ncbi:basic secretory protein-like protein [Actinophytocola sp. KF-1]
MQPRSKARRWLGAAVAAVALAGIALVSLPGAGQETGPTAGPGRPMGAVSPAPQADASRTDAVTDLLNRRAKALVAHDEQAFLATLDPKADEAFVSTQRRLFDNLTGVPFDEWSYRLRPDDALDVAEVPDRFTSVPSDELWAPAVDLRYALRGADVIPTERTMGFLFARHGDDWYLRSDTALDGLGRRTWRGPWDFAPCVVTTTEHGIVLSHPGSQPMVDRLVRELDPSVRAVSELWPTPWSRRVALMLPDSPGEMRALVGPDFPVESVVAVAVADRVDNKTRTVAGQRVVLSPTGVRSLSIASLRIVLRHEITHLAARADTVDGSPTWLLEGFADWVGYRDSGVTLAEGAPDLAKQVRQDGPPAGLPEDRAFRSGGSDLDLAYQQSWSLARYVAETYGEDRLIAMYRELAAAGAVSATETDRMLRDVLGADRAELVRGWQSYLRKALK